MPETNEPDTNVYDIRVVRHEDGWIYGLFCTERKDRKVPQWDTSLGGGAMRNCTNQGPGEVGAAARPADEISPAEERCAASGICGWKVRAVHAAAG